MWRAHDWFFAKTCVNGMISNDPPGMPTVTDDPIVAALLDSEFDPLREKWHDVLDRVICHDYPAEEQALFGPYMTRREMREEAAGIKPSKWKKWKVKWKECPELYDFFFYHQAYGPDDE